MDNTTYINREISWLQFNNRVLQEAGDDNNPLQERIKFLGIYSNNQDEFFRVRVGTLNRLVTLNEKEYPKKAAYYRNILNEVYDTVRKEQQNFSNVFEEVRKDLENKRVYLLNENEISEDHGHFVKRYFKEEVRQYLFPILIKKLEDPEYLKDKNIYLGVILHREKKPDKPHLAIIKIPTANVDRFLVLPSHEGNQYIIMLDDVIRYCLDDIFGVFNYSGYEAYTFKFSRDAELDIEEDVSKSFLEILSDSLKKRKTSTPVRFVYDRNMPEMLRDKILSKISGSKTYHLVEGDRYHNSKDFMNFPDLLGNQHAYKKIEPVWHKDIIEGKSIFDTIQKKDILLHFPYQPFNHILDMLREASIDPKVRSIKMTLYRVANPSAVINALINAARNGKSVKVFLEVQARFDEKQNIYLASKLQEAGVRIIKNIPGFKIHAKLLLIRRKIDNKNLYYGYIGTGNFNESTAKQYVDVGLLTSDRGITHEIRKVFELFEATYRPMRFRHLIVSPFSTRNFFMKMLEYEINEAKAGRKSWAIIKLNNLDDKRIVNKLYKASQAGVKIKMIIRSICTLVPGVKGVSENIEVFSILDKYLEHARITAFCHGGDKNVFIGSADWMGRNLDNRVEVTAPVRDETLKQELLDMLDIQLRDNTKARIVDGTFANRFKRNKLPKVRIQWDTYDYLKQKHDKKQP
ncbi:MAG: polyphosphate kinase 1 [Bacteroidota bacterium]|nr:polyphosphate kinase 1 [Bacteroidota bacterium]